ncbi:formylglycine-generating enzyme family protein [Mixta gaviniae]|uniref:Serine/threonine protein kinase n=1 Tax=Mixta gaviniae TaxID=665914 RepID=A0A2L0IBN9_9GAMM|nr:SUMF1/EgtB/PvdO family nonheme iron enzyme [Mixta gaviniae]AUX91792.1 serine/threonine protein kinase [Mixta gaviniae]
MSERAEKLTLTGLITENADLSGKKINELTFREAMGLPPYAVNNQLDNIGEDYRLLAPLESEALVAIISDKNSAFTERYAAGNLLALKGDPRIKVYEPEMITVPAAKVVLGLPEQRVKEVTQAFSQYGVIEEWIRKECPAYQATLPAFALGKYCVTNWEYYCFLTDSGYEELPDSWPFGVYPRQRANYPVYSLSCEAATAYAAWLSAKTGRAFHLPTEAQWEYAATGTDGRDYPWGDTFLPDRCNSVESGIIDATPVGLFPHGAGPFGHLDMAGNVEEYTADVYRPYGPDSAIRDDLWLTQGSDYCISRGGSFTRFRDLCRTRRRHGRYDSELYIMGFRLAENIER